MLHTCRYEAVTICAVGVVSVAQAQEWGLRCMQRTATYSRPCTRYHTMALAHVCASQSNHNTLFICIWRLVTCNTQARSTSAASTVCAGWSHSLVPLLPSLHHMLMTATCHFHCLRHRRVAPMRRLWVSRLRSVCPRAASLEM